MKISETIREAVRESVLSRYELAKRSGVPESTLCRFLAGGGLKVDSLDKLAPLLGLELVVSKSKAGGSKRSKAK